MERTGREKEACSKALIWVCVSLFVKKHERDLTNFAADFGCPTAAVDEKADLLRSFLREWHGQMEEDPAWHGKLKSPEHKECFKCFNYMILNS